MQGSQEALVGKTMQGDAWQRDALELASSALPEGGPAHLEAGVALAVNVLYYEQESQRGGGRRSPQALHLRISSEATLAKLAGEVSRALAQQGGGAGVPVPLPAVLSLRFFYRGKELRDQRRSLASLGLPTDCHLSAIATELSSVLRVEELTPSGGSEAGGVEVHISGKNFAVSSGHPFVVRFGSVAVPARPITEELARCIAPPHAPGVVSVEVSNGGVHFTDNGVSFTYVAHADSGSVAYPVRATSGHCASLKISEEIERAAMRHSREF